MIPTPKLGIFLLSLVIVTGATAFTEAFFSEARVVRIRKSKYKPIRTISPVPMTNSDSFSSLAAWHLSFGAAKKLPKIGKDGMYKITNEEDYRYVLNAL